MPRYSEGILFLVIYEYVRREVAVTLATYHRRKSGIFNRLDVSIHRYRLKLWYTVNERTEYERG